MLARVRRSGVAPERDRYFPANRSRLQIARLLACSAPQTTVRLMSRALYFAGAGCAVGGSMPFNRK